MIMSPRARFRYDAGDFQRRERGSVRELPSYLQAAKSVLYSNDNGDLLRVRRHRPQVHTSRA
jgi:hypothetical protein